MRRFFIIALFLVAASLASSAQTSTAQQTPNAPVKKSPLVEYAGSWVSTVEGHAWLTLRLVLQGSALSGGVQRAKDFKFSDDGAIKSVSDDQINETVQSAVLQGDGLLITVKDPNAQEPARYLMRLTAANTALIKIVGMSMPPGMSKPQPWKLTRVTTNAIAPVRPGQQ